MLFVSLWFNFISSFGWFYLQPLTLVANWNKYICTLVRPKDRRNQLKIKILNIVFMKCCFLSIIVNINNFDHEQKWHVLIYLIYLNRRVCTCSLVFIPINSAWNGRSPNVIYCSPQLFIFIEPIYTCVKLVFTKY
jgi:hypothetical protein